MEQLSMLPLMQSDENEKETQEQIKRFEEYAKQKRNWENAFQKWSNEKAIDVNVTESYGCCGYGSMCDYCEDNSYGRPCVRALNKMCREKRLDIDYSNRSFEEIWRGW